MIRFLVTLLFLIPMFGLLIGTTLAFLRDMYGLPYNPFKWAQERRRRLERARERRISVLEHDLGYRPCSDEHCLDPKCIVSKVRNGGHPIWDNPALPAPPPMMPIDDLAKKAYDKDIALRTRRGTASGGPN